MKNKNKTNAFLMMSVLMMSVMCVSISAAQHEIGVPITAGDTIESTLGVSDISASTILGGLVANVQTTIERFVSWAGVKIYKDSTGSQQELEFQLIAVEAGSEVDLNNIVFDSVFQTSEADADINGVVGTWNTNFATTGIAFPILDGQTASIVSQDITLDNTEIVAWNTNFADGEIASLLLTNWKNTAGNVYAGGIANPVVQTCTDDICPTAADLEEYYSLSVSALSYVIVTETDDGTILKTPILVASFIGDGVQYVMADMNSDGIISISDGLVDCYSTNAQSGEALMIMPAGTYDVYGILPA